MPELPEVETVVRTLRPQLVGRNILAVWSSGLPLRMQRMVDVEGLRSLCRGTNVRSVARRAKYILIDLERRGRHAGIVLVHLGMTGRLRIEQDRSPRVKHTHVAWRLSGALELRFVDPRRFGSVQAASGRDDFPELALLGPDALTALKAEDLAVGLAKSVAPIKAFLLDQRRVSGLGNIYVCEALFRARIHPRTPARRTCGQASRLVNAIRKTLDLGIANCGTSFRDFVDAHGEAGTNLEALLVYGRDGEPCTRCGTDILRSVDAGRSTFFCARCQKR